MPTDTSLRANRFFASPSTKPGRLSAALFLIGLAGFAVSLVLPFDTQIRIGPIDPILTMMLVGFVGAFAAGAVALVGSHERSWAVWLATLLPVLVIAADVGAGLLSGGG